MSVADQTSLCIFDALIEKYYILSIGGKYTIDICLE